jgi:hypothetical protein
MPEYTLGKETSRKRKRTNYTISCSVPARVYARLEQMRDSLQRELGPDIPIHVSTIVRRILYAHQTLRKLAHRHQPDPPEGLEL